jgi:hypothetical protein
MTQLSPDGRSSTGWRTRCTPGTSASRSTSGAPTGVPRGSSRRCWSASVATSSRRVIPIKPWSGSTTWPGVSAARRVARGTGRAASSAVAGRSATPAPLQAADTGPHGGLLLDLLVSAARRCTEKRGEVFALVILRGTTGHGEGFTVIRVIRPRSGSSTAASAGSSAWRSRERGPRRRPAVPARSQAGARARRRREGAGRPSDVVGREMVTVMTQPLPRTCRNRSGVFDRRKRHRNGCRCPKDSRYSPNHPNGGADADRPPPMSMEPGPLTCCPTCPCFAPAAIRSRHRHRYQHRRWTRAAALAPGAQGTHGVVRTTRSERCVELRGE